MQTGPHVRLDPLTLADAALMAALLEDDKAAVMNTATFPWPCTAEAMREWVAPRLGVANLHAIRRVSDDAFIGTVSWREASSLGVPSAGRGAVIGYWTGRAYRGQGLTAEAVALAVDLLRHGGGWTEVIADIFAENAASRRLVERLGFAFDTEYVADVPQRGGARLSARYRLPLS